MLEKNSVMFIAKYSKSTRHCIVNVRRIPDLLHLSEHCVIRQGVYVKDACWLHPYVIGIGVPYTYDHGLQGDSAGIGDIKWLCAFWQDRLLPGKFIWQLQLYDYERRSGWIYFEHKSFNYLYQLFDFIGLTEQYI